MALNGSPKPDVIFFMTDGNRSDEHGLDRCRHGQRTSDRGPRTVIHTSVDDGQPDACAELDDLPGATAASSPP
jgi:hypothetical protein